MIFFLSLRYCRVKFAFGFGHNLAIILKNLNLFLNTFFKYFKEVLSFIMRKSNQYKTVKVLSKYLNKRVYL